MLWTMPWGVWSPLWERRRQRTKRRLPSLNGWTNSGSHRMLLIPFSASPLRASWPKVEGVCMFVSEEWGWGNTYVLSSASYFQISALTSMHTSYVLLTCRNAWYLDLFLTIFSSLFLVMCRMKWQVIRALQMFVEHVVLKHEGMLPYARRLNLVRLGL